MQSINPRQMACDILYQVIHEGKFSNKLIQTAIDQGAMSEVDKRFARTLIYGVLEKSMALDWWLEQLSSVKIKKIEPKTRIILKMAMYQIAFLERIPNSAAVDEAVKLTKRINFKSAGFVNAVLRSFIRLEGQWPYPDRQKDATRYLSVYYSHPLWLVERWTQLFGQAEAEKLLAADNEIPQISIRCNTLKTTTQALAASLAAEGYRAEPHELIKEALVLTQMGEKPLHLLKAFQEGHFFVQDLSAMLVGLVADPKPGDVILDMCAAPGGKTTHLAQLMGNEGRIVSRDVNQFKTKQIDENIQRMGMSCVTLEVADGLIFNEADVEKYDKIILDAPCSGLGIIRRKPEIRYNRSLEDLDALAAIQKKMLELAAKYVKPQGELIYSTCTIDPKENDEVLAWFLENHPEFQLKKLPDTLKHLSSDGEKLKLYQSADGFDGFYIVKLYHSK